MYWHDCSIYLLIEEYITMKRFTLSLALLVVVSGSFSPCVKAQTVSNSVAQVSKKQLDIKPSLSPVKAPIRLNNTRSSGQAEALVKKGYELFNAEKYQESISYFTQALQVDPNNLDAIYYRGLSYFSIKEFQKSVADLDVVIKAYPEFPGSYAIKGLDEYYLGDKDKAVADLETAATLYSKAGNAENAKNARDAINEIKAS